MYDFFQFLLNIQAKIELKMKSLIEKRMLRASTTFHERLSLMQQEA